MHTVKGKVEPLCKRNRNMPQNHSRCNLSSSLGKMPPFNSEAISNVVNLLLSKQNFTQTLKEKIEGLQKDVAQRETKQRSA